MREQYIDLYNLLRDFAIPILAVLFSWIVARYSAQRGAEFGARAASALEREKNTEAARAQQIDSLNRAIFTASMQINDLSVWWRHISKEVDNEMAWVSLEAFEDIVQKDIQIPIGKLGFLWSEPIAQLLVDLSIAQSQYEHTLAAMNERSRFHREVIQPKVSEIATVRDPATRLIGFDLSQVLWDLVEKAQRNTSNVFEHVARTLVNHERILHVWWRRQSSVSRILDLST